MGIINSGLQSIAEERARAIGKIERISSEVTESVADELVETATSGLMMESAEGELTNEELEELLRELPDDAELEKEEIARILACDDEDIDIDDIVGVVTNTE